MNIEKNMITSIHHEEETTIEINTKPRASDLPFDIEDEVSWVIHEFRRQGSQIPAIEKGKTFHSKSKRTKRPYPGYFSNVRYCSAKHTNDKHETENVDLEPFLCNPYIEVSYLFDKVLSLKFQVYILLFNIENNKDTQNSYQTFVRFTDDNDKHYRSRELLRGKLDSICKVLNDNQSGPSSLFAILSKLLMALNRLQSQAVDPTNKTNQNSLLLSNRGKNSHLERILRNNTCCGGVDLAILLLRSAATGKHSDVFCNPFPHSHDPIAQRIWKYTEHHRRFERRRKDNKTERPNTAVAFHPSEHEFLGFLCSLPWMQHGKIMVRQKSYDTNELNQWNRDMVVFEVCLELDSNCESNVLQSPQFARYCQNHGSLTVYHGTDMENVWSILHNGFFNASEMGRGGNEFVKNGAMLGSGVYLTTSKKVAEHFATSNAPTRAVKSALKHDALANLLSMDKSREWIQSEINGNDNAERSLVLDDLYDVSCFSVFEARIVRPPQNEGNKDSSLGPPSHQHRNEKDLDTFTRRDGKYYVVPDGKNIRITKLYLTFELTRKNRGVKHILLSRFVTDYTAIWPIVTILALIVAFLVGAGN